MHHQNASVQWRLEKVSQRYVGWEGSAPEHLYHCESERSPPTHCGS